MDVKGPYKQKSRAMEDKDIIVKIYDQGLQRIIEKIFVSLDYECVKQALLVSPNWKRAIEETLELVRIQRIESNDGVAHNRLLKKLLAIFGSVNAGYSNTPQQRGILVETPLNPDELHSFVQGEAEALARNWERFKFRCKDKAVHLNDFNQDSSLLYLYFTHPTKLRHCVAGNWFILHDAQQRIFMLNRWDFKIQRVLEIPVQKLNRQLNIVTIREVVANENFIIASLCGHPKVGVWDSRTGKLVTVFEAPELLGVKQTDAFCNSFRQDFARSDAFGQHCFLAGQVFLTVSHNEKSGLWEFTARRIPTIGEDQQGVSILYQKSITFSDGDKIRVFGMDENFIIILQEKVVGNENTLFQVRDTSSFAYVSSIKVERDVERQCLPRIFDYSNGVIVTYCVNTGVVRIWDAASGVCWNTFLIQDPINALRLISNKYILGCSLHGHCYLWNLQSAIKIRVTSERNNLDEHLLQSIPLRSGFQQLDDHVMSSLFVDDFQIIVGMRHIKSGFPRDVLVYSRIFLKIS